ncbi:MAG TPA: TadE/TadG family type IV pilus assembly protein [Verrucomicrobiae bacterium]|nr:TadE/TadG family type IV pilus assembly protein [Verrucomicrobiae bacterium]
MKRKLKHISRRAPGRGESGHHLVEFALVVPVLALLLCGICQYGFIYAASMTVRNATMTAARYAILSVTNIPTIGQVQDFAEHAVAPMLDPTLATATVNTNVTVGGVGGATSVQIQYDLPLVIPWVLRVARGTNAPVSSISLTATTIMR